MPPPSPCARSARKTLSSTSRLWILACDRSVPDPATRRPRGSRGRYGFTGCQKGPVFPISLMVATISARILPAAGNPVGIQTPAEVVAGEQLDQIGQRDDSLFCARGEAVPVPNVLFRPEEIHRASGIGDVSEPLPEGNGHVSHQPIRLGVFDHPIPDLSPGSPIRNRDTGNRSGPSYPEIASRPPAIRSLTGRTISAGRRW